MYSTTIEASQISQSSSTTSCTGLEVAKSFENDCTPAPSLDEVDQKFNTPFDEKKHREKLRRELKVDHLPPDLQKDLTELIKKYWPVFDDDGLFIPVKDYE
jgi:uncharacterized protein (UPF0218 family)